jgi:centrosomal protein CEP78
MLDSNESLISLDLRDNPGFILPYSKEIFDKLVRNIRLFKEGRVSNPNEENEEELNVRIYF